MYTRKFMQDMSKSELMSMRETGMSNIDIARSLGCSPATVIKLIGKQPREMTIANRRGAATHMNTVRRMDGTPSETFRGGAQMPEEAPKRAALVVKPTEPQPISLHGACMDYHIPADRSRIDVETAEGRCLMQIPAEMLDTLIDELNAIKNNIHSDAVLPFWG